MSSAAIFCLAFFRGKIVFFKVQLLDTFTKENKKNVFRICDFVYKNILNFPEFFLGVMIGLAVLAIGFQLSIKFTPEIKVTELNTTYSSCAKYK